MAFGLSMQFTVGELCIEMAPFSKEDMHHFINPGLNQRNVNRYLDRRQSFTIEDELEWYEKVRTDKSSLVWGIWLVEEGTRTLIGNSSLTEINVNGALIRQATSGSLLFRQEDWRKGIASAAHKARTWHAFTHLGMHRIMSAVIHGNIGSRKALAKSGYELVYVERNTVFIDGSVRHQDNLECLNPNTPFWNQWWGTDRPTKRALEARRRTLDTLNWAEKNVELL
jgi:RimJ/RimL family protein N-acetyltransferase